MKATYAQPHGRCLGPAAPTSCPKAAVCLPPTATHHRHSQLPRPASAPLAWSPVHVTDSMTGRSSEPGWKRTSASAVCVQPLRSLEGKLGGTHVPFFLHIPHPSANPRPHCWAHRKQETVHWSGAGLHAHCPLHGLCPPAAKWVPSAHKSVWPPSPGPAGEASVLPSTTDTCAEETHPPPTLLNVGLAPM